MPDRRRLSDSDWPASPSGKRAILRHLVFVALRASLLPRLLREVDQRAKVTIITYHAPSPEVFDAHLTVLKRIYNIIALSDYVATRTRGSPKQLPVKSLIITLDDGHRTNHDLKAVIEKHAVPVTIFLCSGLVGTQRRFWFRHVESDAVVQRLKTVPNTERLRILQDMGFNETKEFNDRQALSDAEIQDLKPSIDFQSHTMFHPILPQCPPETAEAEIRRSKEDLEARLAAEIYALAYPNGSYTERDVALVEGVGYKCALTLDRGSNSDKTPLFKLRRICLPDEASCHELLVKVSGLWGAILPLLRGRLFGFSQR